MPPTRLSRPSQPRISVVMPIYNRAQRCVAAIESILGQTFDDFEFVIVNDGSTDGTADVLDGFARQDRRIRVLHQECNQGVAASLNVGIGHAQGELIARMDSDDWAFPHRLERQLAFMDRNPRIGGAGSAMELIDERDGARKIRRMPTNRRRMRALLLRDCVFAHPTMILRRDLVLRLGGYRRAFESAEDYDLWLRVIEHAGMTNLPDVLMQYRIHPEMVSKTRNLHQRYHTLVARFAARRRWRGDGDPFMVDTIHDDETMEEMLELTGDEKREFWFENFRIAANRRGFAITSSHTNVIVPLDRLHMAGLS